MKIEILSAFLGLMILFGCLGQTNTSTTSSAGSQLGGQENYTAELTAAINNGNTALVESLINKGADVNVKLNN